MENKFILNPAEIQNLAPLPSSVGQLAQMLTRAEADFKEVVEVIKFDEALTANVLRWANSAWSGASIKILTIKDAVVRLGLASLLKLAVGHGISTAMKNQDSTCRFSEKNLWEHSVISALTAEVMGKFSSVPVPPVAFTAALMHDIGKLLLGRNLSPEKIREIEAMVQSGEKLSVEAEVEILGTDHARVGGEIAWFWKFPEELIKAIEQHHAFEPTADNLVDTVQIANATANFIASEREGLNRHIKINLIVMQRMGITASKFQMMYSMVKEKLEETLKNWAP